MYQNSNLCVIYLQLQHCRESACKQAFSKHASVSGREQGVCYQSYNSIGRHVADQSQSLSDRFLRITFINSQMSHCQIQIFGPEYNAKQRTKGLSKNMILVGTIIMLVAQVRHVPMQLIGDHPHLRVRLRGYQPNTSKRKPMSRWQIPLPQENTLS